MGASVNPAWGGNQLMEWLQKSNLSGRLSQLVSKLVDRKLLGHRQLGPSSSLAVTADSFREDRGSGPEGTSTGATI